MVCSSQALSGVPPEYHYLLCYWLWKISWYNWAASGPSGFRRSRVVQDRSSALGPLSGLWQKGGELVGQRSKLIWTAPLLCPCRTPRYPSSPLSSGNPSLAGFWIWVMSSCALLLETSHPPVPLSIFMDPPQCKRLSNWDSSFQSPKQLCWEYLAHLSISSVLWMLFLDSTKSKSWEVNLKMLTSLHSTVSHPWEHTLQIPLLRRKKGRKIFEHPHLVETDPSKSLYISWGCDHVHLFSSV